MARVSYYPPFRHIPGSPTPRVPHIRAGLTYRWTTFALYLSWGKRFAQVEFRFPRFIGRRLKRAYEARAALHSAQQS